MTMMMMLNKTTPNSLNHDNEFEDHSSLTLLHSNISSLLYQIDELVVKALELNKSFNKEGKREIESFSNLLSEMLSRLKPWLPKLKISLSSTSVESETKSEQVSCNESNGSDCESPEVTTLVSPSPLVSWRANCTVQRGNRQMFMLTPLPLSKAFTSSKPNQAQPISDFSEFATLNNNSMLCNVVMKPTPIKPALSLVNQEAEDSEEVGLISSPDCSKRDTSMLVMMTPCLKMSPPKSCVLLEPISEKCHVRNGKVRKSTPFPVGVHYSDSEDSESSSSDDVSRSLALKYPELMGIQKVPKSGIGKKIVEESPVWRLTSPPKTCVLLGTPDEKSLGLDKADSNSCIPILESILNQKVRKLNLKEDICKGHNQAEKTCNRDNFLGNLSHIESTPMWLKPESTVQRGKRPGENTLKRELWTKFEEASTCGIQPKLHKVSKNSQKGFLDLLEEASCDE